MSSDPFEESLPDIQNFTILTSGLDHDDDDEKVVENGLDYEVDEKDEQINKRKPKKMRSEEVREEKEAKRLEREMLKQQRAQEKAEAKVLKEAEKTSRRAMKPGTCLMYVRVQLDRHLLEHPDASQVISHLVAAEIKFEIVDSPVSCTATVVRIDPLSMQETLAEDAVILLPVVKFIELVERQIYHNGIAGLIHQCKQWKMELGNPRLTLVVAGIQNYFRYIEMSYCQ
ncbi:hypothetical protein SK128_006685 [Halocaridina rubra]|uniref:Uncharacterized protein n=1 Tax=Halocaridina rubra TaxID=373956 RepID=A0AAN8XFK8_HALRR